MQKRLLAALTGAVFSVLCPAVLASETNCAAMLDEALKTDMALTYKEFDQTQGLGFRRLVNNSCYKEGADLIEAYITVNNADQSSLIWHIAQLRAMHGNYEQALIYARKSLNPSEDLKKRPLRWNDYVYAVIGFLESDKQTLVYHRDKVAEGVDEYAGNAMNLKVLDSYIKHFDRSYAYASNQVGK